MDRASDTSMVTITPERVPDHFRKADSKLTVTHVAPPHQVERLTDSLFVVAWIANFLLVTANAALFIFADWIAWLATSNQSGAAIIYQEELPGRIIQTGLIAAIIARLFLGRTIDRFGVRRVWIVLSVSTLIGSIIFAGVAAVSPVLYAGRVLYAVGVSGMFTCSAFHMQACVAEHRRTEFLGLLGSSGFIGMILGTQLIDGLKWLTDGSQIYFGYAFLVVIVCNATYLTLVWVLTKDFPRPSSEIRPSLLRLMKDYWPGPVVLVAMAIGLVFTVPSLYLVRFNRYAGLGGIAGYWTAYALSAFVLRIVTVQLSQKVGRYRLITVGLLAQGTGLLTIIPATQSWHLIMSAVICGLGHALLFPSIVSLGSDRFPAEYRGSGTNLTLGFMDLGTAISAPLLGRIIDLAVFDRAGYPQMFFVAGVTALGLGLVWETWHWGRFDGEITQGQNGARSAT
ncbi:MAG: MFS transporter [Fuerstiella sp.]|nr:MFS transporter [Fuerstiella sp.]